MLETVLAVYNRLLLIINLKLAKRRSFKYNSQKEREREKGRKGEKEEEERREHRGFIDLFVISMLRKEKEKKDRTLRLYIAS